MAKKNRNDYFKLMEEQLEYSVQASELLKEILCNFSAKEVPAQREKIHSIEHKADEIHHDILAKLSAEVNTIESDADNVYVEAIHELFAKETESKVLISSKAIYESLENCCDLCERAADVIEQIIIKNT